jgi:hypothetical protein
MRAAPGHDREPERDQAATEPPADEPPESPPEQDHGSGERGGPYGNPGVDEEALRKRQEERSRRDPDG